MVGGKSLVLNEQSPGEAWQRLMKRAKCRNAQFYSIEQGKTEGQIKQGIKCRKRTNQES